LSILYKIAIKILLTIIKVVPSRWTIAFIERILLLTNYRKQVTVNNLRISNVDKDYIDDSEGFYRKTIYNIARIITESIYNPKVASIQKLSYAGVHHLEQSCQDDGGAILLASHYGNWELACMHMAKQTKYAVYGVYKPLKNHVFDQWLLDNRSRYGLDLIPMNKIARTVAANHANGISAIYILIADQNPRSENSIIWTEFLGIRTAFSNGAAKLHSKYGLPLYYMNVTPLEELFSYEINIEHLDSTTAESIVKSYSQRLAGQIRLNPHPWLWSHKRWKRS